MSEKAKKPKKAKKQAIPVDPTLVWMIRRKTDGWFSIGGTYPVRWRPHGKIWTSHGKLLAHLRRVDLAQGWWQNKKGSLIPQHPYFHAEVVQVKMVELGRLDVIGYGE